MGGFLLFAALDESESKSSKNDSIPTVKNKDEKTVKGIQRSENKAYSIPQQETCEGPDGIAAFSHFERLRRPVNDGGKTEKKCTHEGDRIHGKLENIQMDEKSGGDTHQQC